MALERAANMPYKPVMRTKPAKNNYQFQMAKQVKKMTDFKENKLKNLDKVVGGLADPLHLATVTGVLDGVRHNTDFCIGRC